MHTAPVRALAALSLVSTLAAQQSAFEHESTLVFDPNWDPLGACIEAQSGRVFGTLGLDAVLLFEDGPVVYKQPEVYRAAVRIGAPANDIAVYPRVNGPDWIFVARTSGLSRLAWDGTQFVDGAPTTQPEKWLDATSLGVANLENQGNLDVYALHASRTKILVCRAVGAIWDTAFLVPLGETIESVVAVQWNGAGYQELAARTHEGVRIVNFQGDLIASLDVPHGDGAIRAVDVPGSTCQALLVPSGSGASECVKVIATGGEMQSLPLAGSSIVGLGLGDLDLDLDTDFVLSHRAGPTLDLFHGGLSGQSLHFESDVTNPSIWIDDYLDYAANQATPGVADFDGDGDPDVVFPPAGTDRVDLYSNLLAVDDALFMCEPQSGWMTLEPEGGAFHLSLLVPPAAQDSNWTDIEVRAWRQPRFDYLVEQEPYLPPSYYSFEGQSEIVVDLQTPHYEWFEDLYHLEVRLVRRENGVKVDQGPGMIAAVGLRQPLMALAAIEGILGHGELYGITFDVPPQFEPPPPPPPPPGPLPIEPVPVDGTPNPRFDGHGIVYPPGTWGGGSGCLPDIPDFQTGQVPPP